MSPLGPLQAAGLCLAQPGEQVLHSHQGQSGEGGRAPAFGVSQGLDCDSVGHGGHCVPACKLLRALAVWTLWSWSWEETPWWLELCFPLGHPA